MASQTSPSTCVSAHTTASWKPLERLHGSISLTQRLCSGLEPRLELAGGNLGPRAPRPAPPLVAPSLFPAVYFLVERNKVTNHDAVFFQGK